MVRRNDKTQRSGGWGTSTVSILLTATAGTDVVSINKKLVASDLFDNAPARSGVTPSSARIERMAVNIRTGASYASQGTMCYYWTNDNDAYTAATLTEDLNSIIRKTNGRNGLNPRGMLCSVNRFPYDSKNHNLQDDTRSISWRNANSGTFGGASVIGNFGASFPLGISPVASLEITVRWEGANSSADSSRVTPQRSVLYQPSELNLDFFRSAFLALALDFAYKSKLDQKKILWSRALQIVFFRTDQNDEPVPVKLCVVHDINTLTYSPNWQFMFPQVLEDGTMVSRPSRWTQAAISNPLLDEDEVWYAHSDNFETDLAELDISSAYTRVTPLSPQERTTSELLTAGMLGKTAINVNGCSVTELPTVVTPLTKIFKVEDAVSRITALLRSASCADAALALAAELRNDFATICDAHQHSVYTPGSNKHQSLADLSFNLINFYENHDEDSHSALCAVVFRPNTAPPAA